MKLTVLLATICLLGQDQATALKLASYNQIVEPLTQQRLLSQVDTKAYSKAEMLDWIMDLVKWFEDKYQMVMDMVKEYELKMKKASWKEKIAKIKAARKGKAQLSSSNDDLYPMAKEANLLMTKILEGAPVQVGTLPRDLKSLVQMGMSPTKLAQFSEKTHDSITADDFVQLYMLAHLADDDDF